MESSVIGPNFAMHTGTMQDMCEKYQRDLYKIEGARSGTKILFLS